MIQRKGASTKEAAEHFGVSRQALHEKEKKGLVIRFPDRSIDLVRTAVLIGALTDPRGGDRSPDKTEKKKEETFKPYSSPLSLTAESARLKKAQADNAELDLQEKRHRLHDADTVELLWNHTISRAKARLIRITADAPKIRSASSDAEAKRILKDMIFKALTDLSEYNLEDFVGASIEDDEDDE